MTGKVANLSNYPNGFNGGLSVRGIPSAFAHAGKVYYVGDTTTPAFPNRKGPSNGNKGTFLDPFADIDYAISQCVDNRGDVIVVLPDHEETVSAASGITVDVAGVTIVGQGGYNAKPKVSFGAAAATIVVSAADVTISNLNLTAAFADVVTGIVVTGVGCTISGVDFRDDATAENWLIPISATGADNTADGLKVVDCRWSSPDAAGTEFIALANTVGDLVVDGNYVVHEGTLTAQLVKGAAGAAIPRCSITNNFLSHKMTALEVLLDIDTASTGIVAHNRVRHADVTTTIDMGIDGIGLGLFDNLNASTDALSGFVLPAIDVDA